MIGGASDDSAVTRGAGPLDVGLVVEADSTSAAGCPLGGRELHDVKQTVTRSADGEDATCQVAIDDERCGYERTEVGDTCPCALFEEHDCIADLESVSEGQLRFSLVVPDRAVLRSVVEDLRSIGASVAVERIRSETAGNDDPSDASGLTRKQREALALAIESGYYDRPRAATLGDLADELGVTRSAVSQRLTAIERKLVCERARDAGLGEA